MTIQAANCRIVLCTCGPQSPVLHACNGTDATNNDNISGTRMYTPPQPHTKPKTRACRRKCSLIAHGQSRDLRCSSPATPGSYFCQHTVTQALCLHEYTRMPQMHLSHKQRLPTTWPNRSLNPESAQPAGQTAGLTVRIACAHTPAGSGIGGCSGAHGSICTSEHC